MKDLEVSVYAIKSKTWVLEEALKHTSQGKKVLLISSKNVMYELLDAFIGMMNKGNCLATFNNLKLVDFCEEPEGMKDGKLGVNSIRDNHRKYSYFFLVDDRTRTMTCIRAPECSNVNEITHGRLIH